MTLEEFVKHAKENLKESLERSLEEDDLSETQKQALEKYEFSDEDIEELLDVMVEELSDIDFWGSDGASTFWNRAKEEILEDA